MKMLDADGSARTLLAGVSLATLAAMGSRQLWILDLATHCRVQYVLAALLTAGWYVRKRSWPQVALALVVALANGWLVLPLYQSAPRKPDPDRLGRPLSLLYLNVLTRNRSYAEVLELVEKEDPDLLALIEVNDTWLSELSPLETRFPFRIAFPRDDNFGMAMFSRMEPRAFERVDLAGLSLPSIHARLAWQGRELNVFLAHLLPPSGPNYARGHRLSVAALVQRAGKLREDLVVLGDLNTTPWGETHRILVESLGLRNGRLSRGVQPTWPTWIPPFWIPIDHCLVGAGIEVLEHRVAGHVGSDHFPLSVRLAPRL